MDKKVILKTQFVEDEEIKNLTTFKTSGKIMGAFYPKDEVQLKNIYQFLKKYNLPFIVIGNGSNLLIQDNLKIFAISTKKMKQKMYIKDNFLYLSASVPLFKIYKFCANRGYGGFESLACIPATVGGAIKNNASAFGQSIFDNLESVNILCGKDIIELNKKDIKQAYHKTNLSGCLIISAKFSLKRKKSCEIKRDFANYLTNKQLLQPQGFSCGCVFKNPNLYSAGKLIESCQLKGFQIGDAIVSQKHANFIINKGNATFKDVKMLIQHIENCVYKKFGIRLEKEVEVIEKI